MTPSSRIRSLFLLLLFLGWLPFNGWAAGPAEPPPPEPAIAPQGVLPPENSSVTPVDPHSTEGENPQEYQYLRHRYRQDPTGVRARLGMCREGHEGGHRHRHRHGQGERGGP
ncbi:MAG: hypothetical protein FWG62_00910 [Proteobacteria bacterium]|nr:hypothetical protein [Pseudomonadota bacterium]